MHELTFRSIVLALGVDWPVRIGIAAIVAIATALYRVAIRQ